MTIHSISNPSSTASSPVLSSSPSTSSTTPVASHWSPVSSASLTSVTAAMTATQSGNGNGNGQFWGSSGLDLSSSLSSMKGIDILNSGFHSTNESINGGGGGNFNITDYFSSSIPKTYNNGSERTERSNSIHIGSLTNGLNSLSLVAAQQSHNPTTSSSLCSGLYSNNNSSFTTFNSGNGTINASINNTHGNGNGNGNSNGNQQEEISTIFVVGFPDDMQEREFQNMFVFTPGFEAATLKIPNKDQQEDDVLTLGVNGINPRKQIIGFAKFRTHQEALQAISVLSGRRVDAEKGSLLKAEMAKKNLHTRRGLSNELVTTSGYNSAAAIPPTPIGINANYNGPSNGKLPHLLQHRNSLAGTAAYDAFHSVPCSPALPSDLLSTHDYPSSYDLYADVYAPNNSNLTFAESFGGRRQNSIQQQSDFSSLFMGRQSIHDMNGVDPLSTGSLGNNAGGLVNSIAGSFPSSFSSRHIGPASSQRFSKSFLESDGDTSMPSSGFISKSIPAHTERGFNSVLFNNEDVPNPRFQGLPINATATAPLVAPTIPSSGVASPAFRPPINPGDQNPPCNTLYVGNLPMNTSEEELRALFSRCPGYRRLCFRTKSNGPMCFVEFENIEYATQALNELYGNPLSNSVKGGIRLSYSKNPLGVRNSTPSQPSGLSNQLHNMNGTPFLDRRDSMTAMFEQHY
ncbi:hypothetical protein BX616_007921 [Lobosporangium transversale]|uniref:RRM domain-containing protein n=1 Tax=Lobosporangium transversale TaxID=64571 RepID=A0A1Y2H308_9FUNG|nr:hypothetical protein BCR41DRAFT_344297 [Lobosporangium transversale]KAF9914610.1 hypothetical protein BX616_007921 [Lobosporangium transversale]ORZ28926.1 hypothetical protein BCR41DRAFT_344297 [Lobosporangium transversale]|eukprot:XP_021886599.1 hypothetical protein BCR41DRAFT_344297 [Lobosporangium transversale]